MISWSVKTGTFVFASDYFCRFTASGDQQEWSSGLPFKIIYEEVACLRRKELSEYAFEIMAAEKFTDRLRLRLKVEDYFIIEMTFKELADGFAVELNPETLIEIHSNSFRVLELDIMPGFFSAKYGEDGYFLLPNFCGALMRFKKETEAELRDMVYGDQPEYEHYVTMPVCGIKKENAAWLCILTEGRYDARIVTNCKKAHDTFNYSLAPGFILRHHKADPVINDLREVKFIYLPGKYADYNTMAVRYREYLLKERGMRPLAERVTDNQVLAYAAESYHCKIFHGMKLGRLYDGKEEMTVTTTFAETEEIARGMKADGIEKCVFFLTGWNTEGHDGKWPTRFPIEEKLGGKDGFMKLKKTLDELGYQLSVHDNYVDAYRASEDFGSLDLLTDRSGETVGGSQWGGGNHYRLCPATMPTPKMLLEMKRMKELGINGIYYLDNMPSPVFTCHHPKHPAGRREYVMGIRRLAQSARDSFGCVTAEGYNDYVLDNLDMPWKVHPPLAGMVRYFNEVPLLDELVPFFQVSYHGIMLYHLEYSYVYNKTGMNAEQAIALEIAMGAMPMNEVQEHEHQAWYSPAWQKCRKQMARHDREINQTRAGRQMVFINSIVHDRDKNLIKTVFADGITFECDLNNGNIIESKL